MTKKQLLMGVGGVLLIAAVWVFYKKYREAEPLYALLQIKEAYENHDLDLFKKHVVIGSVVNNAIDQVVKENIPTDADNPLVQSGLAMASDLLSLVKPRVSETIEDQIYRAVATGKLELEDSGDLAVTSLKKASEPFLEGTYTFETIEEVEREGDTAQVTLRFASEFSKEPFLLRCKMKQIDGDWKLTEILNAAELLRLYDKSR